MPTHCRNIILKRQPVTAPAVPGIPPGAVIDLKVTTPHTSNSGVATATWFSPLGSAPGSLDYVATLTGGVGTVKIISIIPVA